jgi:hypothetical protein
VWGFRRFAGWAGGDWNSACKREGQDSGRGLKRGAIRAVPNPIHAERPAMIILLLTFVTLFLAIFSPCVVALDRYEKNKGLKASKQQRSGLTEARNEVAWRRSKQMILG